MHKNKLRILFVSSELTPIAKVGGLGDVAGALPKALRKLGQDIRVVIPRYGCLDEKKYPLKVVKRNIPVQIGEGKEIITIYQTTIPQSEVILYLIDNKKYFGDNGIYFEKSALVASFKEIQRFLFFSRALLTLFPAINFWPDILHCQDWHVGIVSGLLKMLSASDPRYRSITSVYTIHNLANQGKWSKQEVCQFLKLNGDTWPAQGEDMNLMQQGILQADILNTVSPTYAHEILTPAFGEGLEEDLQRRKRQLYGILNGIDVERFDPKTDREIIVNYTIENIENKMQNKLDLQQTVGFEKNTEIPLFGLVSRLTNQKGIELIKGALEKLLNDKIKLQAVFLGQGTPEFETMLRELARSFPNAVSLHLEFNATLAQKIYAGSDIFLMPSRFEPCGLGQMISLRYGTLPIVRATGGLKDTVSDAKKYPLTGNGFVFEKYQTQELWQAIKRALLLFKNRLRWITIMKRGMRQDFSWEKSSREYLKLYQTARALKHN